MHFMVVRLLTRKKCVVYIYFYIQIEKDLCAQYDVQGFPTLKVFRASTENPGEYGGGRKSADIVKAMKKQGEPAFQNVASADALA